MEPIVILLDTPQKREDMLRLAARGLNTWENAPSWIRDLYDRLARQSVYPPIPLPVGKIKRCSPRILGVVMGAGRECLLDERSKAAAGMLKVMQLRGLPLPTIAVLDKKPAEPWYRRFFKR